MATIVAGGTRESILNLLRPFMINFGIHYLQWYSESETAS